MTADEEADEVERLKGLPELQELERHLYGAGDLLLAAKKCASLLLVVGPEPQGTDSRPAKLVATIEEITANARQEALAIPAKSNSKSRDKPWRCEMLAAAGELFGITDQAEWEAKFPAEEAAEYVKREIASTKGTKAPRKLRAVVWIRDTSERQAERFRWLWYDALFEELRQRFPRDEMPDHEELLDYAHRAAAWLRVVRAKLARERADFAGRPRWMRLSLITATVLATLAVLVSLVGLFIILPIGFMLVGIEWLGQR